MTSTDLATLSAATLAKLAPTVERAQAYAAEARSANTRRAYAAQVRAFEAWCAAQGAPTTRPESVALYLTSRADDGASVATMAQALAAVTGAFLVAGLDSPRSNPVVKETWKGIRRTLGTAQRQARPLLPADLRELVRALPAGAAGLRDRALLLVGFAGAFRRSELVALDVGDVQFTDDGLVVDVRRSKTDQEGHGRKVGLPYGSDPATCPVRALRAWLDAASITTGPVFVSVRYGKLGARLDGRDVARIVQRASTRAGRDGAGLSGHSLRAGLATAAAAAGKSVLAIQSQTGHRSVAMVSRYVRNATLFTDNAAVGIGL